MSKLTLDEVMKELKIIKKLILKDIQIDMKDVRLDKKEVSLDKKFINDSKKIFDSTEEWKEQIWDTCSHKKAISKKGEFDYNCSLLKGQCQFKSCPLNIKR